jgi:hypothetical protein
VLTAVEKYASNHYGAMLYDLFDENSSGKYFRCWGTVVKLSWDCPRTTHRYFVNNLLAAGFTSIRVTILSRYVRSLLKSSSREVRLIAALAAQDKSSNTGSNLAKIEKETGLNPRIATPTQVKHVLLEKEDPVPSRDLWRLPFLSKLIQQRYQLDLAGQKTKLISQFIDSLCIS